MASYFRSASSGAQGCFGWTGELEDASTNLVYLRARDYSPGTGRFTSRDTVRPNGPATQGYNAYHYTANNPTSRVDPTGHNPEVIASLMGAAAVYTAYKSMTTKIRDLGNMINQLPPIARGLVGAILGFVVGILRTLLTTLLFKAYIDSVPLVSETMFGRSVSLGQMAKLFQPVKNFIDACAGSKSICKLAQRLLPKLPCVMRAMAQTAVNDKLGGIDAGVLDYGFAIGEGLTSCTKLPSPGTDLGIRAAARRAVERAGEGSGPAYGSRAHKLFKEELEQLPEYRTTVWSEISYADGAEKTYGTAGSIRVDALVGSPKAPEVIYDLKTGSATLTDTRIEEIRKHLPDGYKDIPIEQIKVEGIEP